MLCPGSSPIRGDEGAWRYVDAATDLDALELATAPFSSPVGRFWRSAIVDVNWKLRGRRHGPGAGRARRRSVHAGDPLAASASAPASPDRSRRTAGASDSRTRVHGTGIPGGRAAGAARGCPGRSRAPAGEPQPRRRARADRRVVHFAATAPDDAWTGSVLVLMQSMTLVAALWTSGLAGVDSWLSRAFVGGAVALAVLNMVWEGTALAAIVGILSGLLTFGIAFVIALSVIQQSASTPSRSSGRSASISCSG